MRRLDPAVLHGVAFDAVPLDQAEDEVSASGGEIDQPLAALGSEFGDDVVWVALGEIRHDEAGIPAGRTPGNEFGFEDRDRKPFLGGMQCRRQAGKAAANDREIDVEPALQRAPVAAVAADGMPE